MSFCTDSQLSPKPQVPTHCLGDKDVNSEIHVPVDTGVRKLGKLESCCRISVNVAKEALVVASIGDLGASTRLLEGGLAT
jgi:hypothetical protein